MDQPAETPSAPAAEPFPSPNHVSPLGAMLSYLVPGLGQLAQGRVAKGALFFGCVYFLFFYGMYLGAAEVRIKDRIERSYRVSSNVFIVQNDPQALVSGRFADIARPQFLGQFWVGMAAWPAIAQYVAFDRTKEDELEASIDRLYDEAASEGVETPEGQKKLSEARELEKKPRHPLLGDIMREPSARAINAVHNAGDKRLEVGWVFTVIAGVLNILVIYDAFAGPAFPERADEDEPAPPPAEEPKEVTT